MLKKAGIVLAASAAGLLAISPLALAGDYEGGHDGDHHSHRDCGCDHGGDRDRGRDRDHVHSSRSLINVSDLGVQVPVQACDNSILSGVLGILSLGQSNRDGHGGQCGQSSNSR